MPLRTALTAVGRLAAWVMSSTLASWPWLPAIAAFSRLTWPTSATLSRGVDWFLKMEPSSTRNSSGISTENTSAARSRTKPRNIAADRLPNAPRVTPGTPAR